MRLKSVSRYVLVLGLGLGSPAGNFLFGSMGVASAAVREIAVYTEKKGEVLHWMPEVIEVTQGETVKFKVSHQVQGGFEFHGFKIKDLNIEQTVDRGKTVEVEKKIALKPGSYPIGCQFHPKHQAAALVVKAKGVVEAVSPVRRPKRISSK